MQPHCCRLLDGPEKRLFADEILPDLKHRTAGMLGMASGGQDGNASQFYITLAPGLDVRPHPAPVCIKATHKCAHTSLTSDNMGNSCQRFKCTAWMTPSVGRKQQV